MIRFWCDKSGIFGNSITKPFIQAVFGRSFKTRLATARLFRVCWSVTSSNFIQLDRRYLLPPVFYAMMTKSVMFYKFKKKRGKT